MAETIDYEIRKVGGKLENSDSSIKNALSYLKSEKLFDDLEELKIFRELYSDTDVEVESSLRKNYIQGIKDFVEYLNNNAFELRHDMELIQKYSDKFIRH